MTFNPRNGQISLSGDVGVGLGYGTGTRFSGSSGPVLGTPNSTAAPIVGLGINANANLLTPLFGASASYQLAGTDPGNRSGGVTGPYTGFGGNANLSGHAEVNLPGLYELEC